MIVNYRNTEAWNRLIQALNAIILFLSFLVGSLVAGYGMITVL
jgi:hypothetical protein